MSVVVIVVVAVLGGLALALLIVIIVGLVLRLVTRRVDAALHRKVAATLPVQSIQLVSYQANYFGRRSAGRAQFRGNGALVLLPDRLVFLPAVGDDLEIDRASIAEVSTARSHLGRTRFQPLLVVDWTDGAGSDRAAWLVPDLARWREALQPH